MEIAYDKRWMGSFMEKTRNLTDFSLILLTGRLPESLLAMSILFDWPLVDMTHVALFNSHKAGMVRWDGLVWYMHSTGVSGTYPRLEVNLNRMHGR